MNNLITQFLSEFDGSPTTIQTYNTTINLFFKWMINNKMDAGNPQRADVTKYKTALKAKNHSIKTVDNYTNSLKSFFKWTDENGYYENIAKHIKCESPKLDMRKHPMTISQVAQLFSSTRYSQSEIDKRDNAMMHLMYFCGLRVIEVCRLNIEDIKASSIMVLGKGRSEKEEVYADKLTLERIEMYLNNRKHFNPHIHEGDALFVTYARNNQNRMPRMTSSNAGQIIIKRMRSIGINDPKVTAHSLRHSIAIHMIDEGATLYDITQKLRHTDANTSRIYTHYIEKKKVRENEQFKAIQTKFSQYQPANAI